MFSTYANAVGFIKLSFVILLAVCAEGSSIGTRMWLGKWSSDTNITDSKRDMYLGIYGIIGVGLGISILVEVFLLTYGCITASHVVHESLLQNILRCPMTFFQTTPIGTILNRFSMDMFVIDERIPNTGQRFISSFMTILGIMFVVSFSTPLFIIVLVPVAFMYILTQVLFSLCYFIFVS